MVEIIFQVRGKGDTLCRRTNRTVCSDFLFRFVRNRLRTRVPDRMNHSPTLREFRQEIYPVFPRSSAVVKTFTASEKMRDSRFHFGVVSLSARPQDTLVLTLRNIYDHCCCRVRMENSRAGEAHPPANTPPSVVGSLPVFHDTPRDVCRRRAAASSSPHMHRHFGHKTCHWENTRKIKFGGGQSIIGDCQHRRQHLRTHRPAPFEIQRNGNIRKSKTKSQTNPFPREV